MPLGKVCPVAVARVENGVDRTRRVMRGEDVHDRLQHVRRVILCKRPDGVAERGAVVFSADIAQNRLLPRVVHDGIELPVGKVAAALIVGDLVGRILPDLADQQRVRLVRADARAQARKERVRQLVDHIQPPAVGAELQPVHRDAVFVVNHIADEIRIHLVDARERRNAPPAVVDVRIVLEPEPAAVGRVRVMDGLLEIRAAAADMAEHAVQNDLHAMRVRLGAERAEILLCAEHGVDPLIVAGVVPVRRPGIEDRVQIQDLHAELLQVRQLFPDAVQIAAVKIVVQDLTVSVRQIDRRVVLVFVHPIGRDLPGQIAAAALAEAVRKDLIHDSACAVGRDGIFIRQHAQLPEAARLHIRVALPLLKEAERAVLRGNMEVVEIEPGLPDGHFPAPGIVKRVV